MNDSATLELHSTAGKQVVFSPPREAPKEVHERIAELARQTQDDIRDNINQHFSQIYTYDGRAAISLKIPGFFDSSADRSSQCMIYEQAHYMTETYDDYDYDIGWTQRLVIKVTKLDAKATLTVPGYVAASCDAGETEAMVQFAVCGLVGPLDNVTGEAKAFNVDQYAEYAVKMQGLRKQVDSQELSIKPVIIARSMSQEVPDNRGDFYRGCAYRLSGIRGIMQDRTAEDWFKYMTTKGKDQGGKAQKIADEAFLRKCIDAAYADYGIPKDKKLSDGRTSPQKQALINTILGDLDGFTIRRQGFD